MDHIYCSVSGVTLFMHVEHIVRCYIHEVIDAYLQGYSHHESALDSFIISNHIIILILASTRTCDTCASCHLCVQQFLETLSVTTRIRFGCCHSCLWSELLVVVWCHVIYAQVDVHIHSRFLSSCKVVLPDVCLAS